MRDRFFNLYVDIKVAERYYCHYVKRSVIWNNIITAIGLITSAATISSWAIWGSLSLVWAVAIASSQVLTVLRPLLKSSARLSAAKYLIPEMARLLDDLSSAWDELNYVHTYSDPEIHELMQKFKKRYTSVREQYAPSELFPEKPHLFELAQVDAQHYFSIQYHSSQEETTT